MQYDTEPPPYPEKSTIALFGKSAQFKNRIGKNILSDKPNAFATTSNSFDMETNASFKIINVPDFFDEECQNMYQLAAELLALSDPGLDLFILVIDRKNSKEEEVVAQISKLQATFGDNITARMVVLLPDLECYSSLCQLEQRFKTKLVVASENLTSECRRWCAGQKSFRYDFKIYSKDVVLRRMEKSENISNDDRPVSCHWRKGDGAHEERDNIYNIVLVGLTGTGKSASANTIMTAGCTKSDAIQFFKSESSSMPVTTECDIRTVEKPFMVNVRLVDTPDFFYDQLRNPQEHINECKKYCKQGRCTVLLVLQLGRVTDKEREILENLEEKLGWEIRHSTIVLLTHGDDLKGSLEKHINSQDHLKRVVGLCGGRHHLFNNNSKNKKQVIELIKKIPDYKNLFPKFAKKQNADCLVV